MRRRLPLATVLSLLVGCGGEAQGPGSGVLQHHNGPRRDGVYVEPALTHTAAASLRLDPAFTSPALLGPTRAEPLYLDGVGGKPDLVVVATIQNHVYALDAATGAAVWDQNLGPPGVRPVDGCGAGTFGILGTPVIDGASRTIYLDALTTVAADGGTLPHKHMIFALDADTGRVRSGWPVDVDAMARAGDLAFDSSVQNQRGALALVNGTVFVPYGAFPGDCGGYRGWIVGVSASDPSRVRAWSTRAPGGGIWGPAGIASDGTSLFFATGNTRSPPSWQDGEAVFKLPPSLEPTDDPTNFYAPPNWSYLDSVDLDLGGTAPLLVDVPGATPSKLVVGLGKDQIAHLLDRENLGGIAAPLATRIISNEAVINAAAAYTTPNGTFVVFNGYAASCHSGGGGQLTSFKITPTAPPAVGAIWCVLPQNTRGSPAVSMIDKDGTDSIVWIVALDDRLYGLDGDTGATVFGGGADTIPGVQRFQAPIIAHGRIFVAASDRVYAFVPGG